MPDFSKKELIVIHAINTAINDLIADQAQMDKPLTRETLQVLLYFALKYKGNNPEAWADALNNPDESLLDDHNYIKTVESKIERLHGLYIKLSEELIQADDEKHPENVEKRKAYKDFSIVKRGYENSISENFQLFMPKDQYQYILDKNCDIVYPEYKAKIKTAERERDEALDNIRIEIDKRTLQNLLNDEEYKSLEQKEKALQKEKEVAATNTDNPEVLGVFDTQLETFSAAKNKRMADVLKLSDEKIIKELGGELKRIQEDFEKKEIAAFTEAEMKLTRAVMNDVKDGIKKNQDNMGKYAMSFYKNSILPHVLTYEKQKGIPHDEEDLAITKNNDLDADLDDHVLFKNPNEPPKTKMEMLKDAHTRVYNTHKYTFWKDKKIVFGSEKENLTKILAIHKILKNNKKFGLTGNSREYKNVLQELGNLEKGLVEGGWLDAIETSWRNGNTFSGGRKTVDKLNMMMFQLDNVYKAAEKYMEAKGPQHKSFAHGQARYELMCILCGCIYKEGSEAAEQKACAKRIEDEMKAGKTSPSIYVHQIAAVDETLVNKYAVKITQTAQGTRGTSTEIKQKRQIYKAQHENDTIFHMRDGKMTDEISMDLINGSNNEIANPNESQNEIKEFSNVDNFLNNIP